MKLGDFLFEGKALEVDIEASIKWYKKAIESFNSTHIDSYLGSAYKKLVNLYDLGYQEAISTAEIIEYLKHEVDYNSESARNRLEEFYLSGCEVGEKYKSMFQLIGKAEKGDEKAQIEYGYSYIVNRYVENTTRAKVIKWYLEGAANGNLDSQYLLSKLYVGDKWGPEYNYWLKRAADQGHAMAQYDLAQEYIDDNQTEAVKYLKLAAKSYVYAQIDLGYDYAHGKLVKQDYKEAYNLYQLAASNMKKIKDVTELRKINYIKFKYNAANDEAEIQANKGNIDAQLYMGCLYQYGFEVKRNKEKAIYWYSIAYNQGSVEANMQLEIIQKDFD
jgi:TPR repeat protein